MSELNLKSLYAMRWEDKDYEDVQQYLKDGSYPPDKSEIKWARDDLRRKAKPFTLDAKGKIELVMDEQPTWTKDVDGNQLYTVKLPYRMKVIKKSNVQKVIKKLYGDIGTNGYGSADKFHARLNKEFLGISREDVKTAVRTFEVAQVVAPNNSDKIVKPIVNERPMQHWQIDLIDMSAHSRLNSDVTFILNVIDHFSKFLWSRPLKNKSAELVKFELQNIILQESAPDVLSSDNGGEFSSEKMKDLAVKFDIDYRYSEPYNPKTNGCVERVNATIKNKIAKFLADHKSKRYIDELQHLVYSYNTSVHATTGFTPFQVHRGRDSRISMLNTLVHENTQKKADKMIASSIREKEEDEEILVPGDSVRIDENALKLNRKDDSGFVRKARGIGNWTTRIYYVKEIKMSDDGIQHYYLNPTPVGEKRDRWFFRHQLMKIDEEALERPKAVTEKQDVNFGAGQFNLERHLVELPKRDQRIANMTEEELERLRPLSPRSESHREAAAASAAASLAVRRPRREDAGINRNMNDYMFA